MMRTAAPRQTEKPDFEIRVPKETDVKLITKCLIDMCTEHATHMPHIFNLNRMQDFYETRNYCLSSMHHDKSRFIVADTNGQVSGFGIAKVRRAFDAPAGERYLYIENFYVVKQFRGGETSHSLIDEFRKIARNEGLKSIQADVYAFNSIMQGLMRSEGSSQIFSRWEIPINPR